MIDGASPSIDSAVYGWMDGWMAGTSDISFHVSRRWILLPMLHNKKI